MPHPKPRTRNRAARREHFSPRQRDAWTDETHALSKIVPGPRFDPVEPDYSWLDEPRDPSLVDPTGHYEHEEDEP